MVASADVAAIRYPLAQFFDLRRRFGRLLETLTVPQRFDSPEIVLEKHDFSNPDCTQSFFCYCEDEDDGTLLRVEQQNTTARYTVAARTLRHEQRVSCYGRHQYSHARLHAKLHTRRPCPLRCVVPLHLARRVVLKGRVFVHRDLTD